MPLTIEDAPDRVTLEQMEKSCEELLAALDRYKERRRQGSDERIFDLPEFINYIFIFTPSLMLTLLRSLREHGFVGCGLWEMPEPQGKPN